MLTRIMNKIFAASETGKKEGSRDTLSQSCSTLLL